MSERSQRVVENELLCEVTLPGSAYAFYFTRRTRAETDKGEVMFGAEREKSVTYYPDGESVTKEDVAKLPDCRILLRNMECNNWDRVVRSRLGNYQPFNEDTQIISAEALAGIRKETPCPTNP